MKTNDNNMDYMNTLIEDFKEIAVLANIDLPENATKIEVLEKPHIAPALLPKNKMAIYIFKWEDVYLKIGKVGSKSNARYTSQHYNPESSKSNLAKSILDNKKALGLSELTSETIGNWIKDNTTRINILIDAKLDPCTLSLFETFLHCRLNPRFEG